MPPQLKTLIPLFAVLLILFLVVRTLLVPESFGEIGHYRADAIEENGVFPINYAGNSACIECHDTEREKIASDAHKGLSCESCHGPGAKHAENHEVVLEKPGTREECGRCHSLNSARRTETVIQVDIKEHHMEKENCIDCHNPHAVWEMKE